MSTSPPLGFGVVLFDHDEPHAGWAAEAGHRAERIEHVDQLSPSLVWWSNLSVTGYLRLRKPYPHLKTLGYLPTDLGSLQNELGLVAPYQPPKAAAEVLSELFARVMLTAVRAYGIDQNPLPLYAETLPDELTVALVGTDVTSGRDVDAAMAASHEQVVFCTPSPGTQRPAYRFRRPRVEHALDVMTSPVPVGPWEWVSDERLPRKGRTRFLLDLCRPVLARATCDQYQEAYQNLVRHNTLNSRADVRFLSHPDLFVFETFARATISGMFVAQTYEPLTLLKPLELASPIGPLSTSISLLTEACLISLLQRTPPRNDIVVKRSQRLVTPRAVWLSAADRFACFSAAIQFQTFGFEVRNFGCGQVSVCVHPQRAVEACKIAALVGLVPPLVLLEEAAAVREQIEGPPIDVAARSIKHDGRQRLSPLPPLPPAPPAEPASEAVA